MKAQKCQTTFWNGRTSCDYCFIKKYCWNQVTFVECSKLFLRSKITLKSSMNLHYSKLFRVSLQQNLPVSSSLETILVNVSLKYICLLMYQPILPYEIRGLEATWKVTFPWILSVHSRGIYFIEKYFPPPLGNQFSQKFLGLIHWIGENK